jgi:magnesium chelatase subunit D
LAGIAMNSPMVEAQAAERAAEQAWSDAIQAALLHAIDPVGTCGVSLRGLAGPTRDFWLGFLRDALPASAPLRRVPLHIQDARLLGGLDLAATLQMGRPVAQKGVLAEADKGVVLLAMAERLPSSTAARMNAVIDTGEVVMERDGMALRQAARLGVVALDEGMADDEQVPSSLKERLAFWVNLAPQRGAALDPMTESPRRAVAAARALLPSVTVSDVVMQGVCEAAAALGIASVRAPILALRVARAAAALDGRLEVDEDDAAIAARLVLGPRATRLPSQSAQEETDEEREDDDALSEPDEAQEPEPEPAPPESADETEDVPQDDDEDVEKAPPPIDPAVLNDLILEAARSAIPPGLLAALKLGQTASPRNAAAGRAGQVQHHKTRGRPSGVRRGEPRAGARLNVIETLRAAAPWQAVRRREVEAKATANPTLTTFPTARIQVRREDFHVTRYQQNTETTTVFVVDASGSAALARLAEAKGAVELLLADCYVRRDRVAVLAFRGNSAEVLLPPTRSLVRAKRSLAGLPGGGGTPLATGIDAALALAQSVQRRGETPIVVFLTDGRGNIARDGKPGRAKAMADALLAARQVRLAGVTTLLLDTAAQPQAAAKELADAMGAGYVPLPYAGATALSKVVKAAAALAASSAAGSAAS